MKFQIISDGACDITTKYAKEHNLPIVPFYVRFDKENYFREGEVISHDEFYRKMDEEHLIPSSSMPSAADFMDAMLPYVEKDIPVIIVCITAKFSGSYNSACVAKDEILEDHPGAKIAVIDSMNNTMALAMFVNEGLRMRDADIDFDTAVARLEEIKLTGRIHFTVGSLEYLIKNGRIGKMATAAGDKLGIRPIIIMKEGDITLGGVARSRQKSKKKVIDSIEKYFADNNLSYDDYSFKVGTGYDYEEAADFQKEIEDRLGIKFTDVDAVIGTTIGCHTGPHPLGVGFCKKYDA